VEQRDAFLRSQLSGRRYVATRGTHPTDLPPVAPYLGGKGIPKQAGRPAERLLIINAVHVGLTATPMIAANVMDFVTWQRQASGFRQLAGEILDGEFRGRLLELALDYEREAENPEHGNFPQQ
jgi:hypothetical protein